MRTDRMLALLMAAVLTVLTASGCASGSGSAPAAAATLDIRIDPSSAQLEPRASATFKATVTGTAATEVTWASDCGSVTQAGVFTAPQENGVCRVTATALSGALVGKAVVTVGGWAAACAAEPLPESNVVYFCDCQPGADTNCVAGNDTTGNGTKGSPFQSWPKARTSSPAGGTLALCKGGWWNVDQGGWSPTSCTASTPCVLRDYTAAWSTGDEAAPVLAVASTLEQPFFWSDGVSNLRILNLHLYDPTHGAGGSKRGIFSYGGTHDIEVCNTTFDGFEIAIQASVSARLATCNNYNWKIRGNRFLNSCVDAMLTYSRDLDVDGNHFDNNGHNLCGAYVMESSFDARDGWPWGPTTHTVYFDGELCPIDNLKFRNNIVTRPAMYQGYGQGSPVKIRDAGDNILIENNVIDFSPAHPRVWGTVVAIGVDNNGDLTKAGFDKMVIRRNRIIGGLGGKIAVSAASNLLIEDNIIVETAPVFEDHHSVITLSHKGASESRATAATVRNNTIYIDGSGPGTDYFTTITLALASSGFGNVVTGNSITITGLAPQGSCFRIGEPAKVAYMNNNQCSGDIGFATVDEWDDKTLAAWRTGYPAFDAASITPPLTGLFVNAPTDFTPALGSPLVGAASTLTTCTVGGVANQPCSSPLAVENATWSPTATAKARDASPDIGAMER